MLDLKLMQKTPDLVRESLKKRGSKIDVQEFLTLDERRKSLIAEGETLKAERNAAGPEIAKCKKSGQDASALLARMAEVSERVKTLDAELTEVETAERDWLMSVPNMPHESVPVGASEADNPVVRSWGEKPVMDFEPKEHWELGTALGGLDFERAAKLAGSRFALSFGWCARLERALAQFMLDTQTTLHGYTEVIPPYIVNRRTMTGTGQLPKFEEDLFKLEGVDSFLIPTAEVPLTNIYAGEVIDEAALPVKFCAHTPCFRSEAGSYGKDTKGLIRLHQFHKVEMVNFAHPDTSYEALEAMTAAAEKILQLLGIHYRVIELCTGDMGFGATKTYDIEVWLPGQNQYREISSCSNCGDFQARRADIRFRSPGSKKNQYVHTLNGSGLAVGRCLVAVMENGQRADGSIVIPDALKPYMGGLEVVEAK
ncbi:MAG: serine--tRNA ligase [Pseudodesulfovibrio sp.]|uniref:Serine--tRNA ligase n=1 Tax=Pseudodesulfovibrio aespoeensis (strain ATCC 700646 / DSM 10631 / Aspo-2) TaxID=643562 RepID=E6VZB4_PSEA9|nr:MULTISPECIES: serine--tRNA ligase [Pseudodesulfovibrio]MBU4475402.1 serine--tRNA ligase [Pseudomonadota bacterium]ADU63986.1 seryl-tRNA synthetase [Pseudodesulfovibrio aespoeensis Aspo-2]MBU4517239.1 serine--tRNA ligase [Pseudomonadota bacterium]MBU4521873.1 serine--tRNA ligase [Pseudomonadota bacterium]MBU4558979.1 serine--tRNA ligase [Pseudomonadota bacterium]